MTFVPKFATVDPLATAEAGAVQIESNDAYDYAVANAARQGLLEHYMRGKSLIGDPNVAFTSKAANTVTPSASVALSAAAANMNGLDAFDLSAVAASPAFRTDIACPASFTMITAIYLNAYKNTNHLLGVTGPKFSAYLNSSGKLAMDDVPGSGETTKVFTNTAVPLATRTLLWFSHDATSKTSRYGTSASVAESHVHTLGHAPGGSNLVRLFSQHTDGADNVPNGLVEGWALFNHPYAASGSGNDIYLAAAINALQGLL